MRRYIGTISHALQRSGRGRGSVRLGREFRPRFARSTFVPLTDADFARGLAH